MTNRLYYDDCYLTQFHAAVIATSDDRRTVYLDQTAFYPTSGGQPFDIGTINGLGIENVIDEGDRIAHVAASPIAASQVEGKIDWKRRFDHMQQHTGQHLLSAVFEELHHAKTVSFHLGTDVSTIDIAAAFLSPAQILSVERRANEIVFENRPVAIGYEDSAEASGLRKASERSGTLRIVSIEGLDRSACGGTHVRRTGEIGPLLIRKAEKIRGNLRIEFLAGMRAITRARADYDALNRIAQSFSSPLDETPGLVAAHIARLADSEKTRRKLTGELATLRGAQLYASGLRHVVRHGPINDEIRMEAQGFTSNAGATFLMISDDPPSLLLAASTDSGINAGDILKGLLKEFGGRGGGNATLAQGSVPTREALQQLVAKLPL